MDRLGRRERAEPSLPRKQERLRKARRRAGEPGLHSRPTAARGGAGVTGPGGAVCRETEHAARSLLDTRSAPAGVASPPRVPGSRRAVWVWVVRGTDSQAGKVTEMLEEICQKPGRCPWKGLAARPPLEAERETPARTRSRSGQSYRPRGRSGAAREGLREGGRRTAGSCSWPPGNFKDLSFLQTVHSRWSKCHSS